jgi:acyl-coenzyme A thioesterase PaaI-like protein
MLRRSGVCRHALAAAAQAAMSKAATEHKGTFGMGLLESAQVQHPQPAHAANVLRFPLTVSEALTDDSGGVNVGAYAALADVFTTSHLWAQDPAASHVSLGFTLQVLDSAPASGRIYCDSTVLKVGKRVAFTEFRFTSEDGSVTYAEGTHTKAMVRGKN